MSVVRRERRLRPAWIGGAALVALLAGGGWQPTLRGVSVAGEGGRLEIGTVRFGGSVFGAALAQAPGEVTLENFTLTVGSSTYRIPRAVFTGVALSREELARLLDPAGAEPIAQRLARLNARQVTIPELIVEQKAAGGRVVTTQRDTVLRDINAGRIASLVSSSSTIAAEGGAPSGRQGALAATDIDLPGIAALYAERAGAAPAPLRRLYGSVTVEAIALRDPKGVEIRIDRGEMRDLQARPTATSWGETFRLLSELKPGEEATPEETRRYLTSLAEILEAFEVGGAELSGLTLNDTRNGQASKMRLARLSYAGPAEGRPSSARAEGIEVDASEPEARIRVGSVTASGFGYGSSFRALAELSGKKPEEFTGADLRRLVPQLGTTRIENLSVETKEGSTAAAGGEGLRYALRSVELTAGRQVNAIPTVIRYSLDGLSLTLPQATEESGLKTLVDLGYRTLDLSMLVAASWEEATSEIALQEVSLRGANMGSVTLRGTVGQAGRDLFNPDSAVAAVALLGATAKNLNLAVENGGLFEAVIDGEARRQGRSSEAIRREYASAASLGIPAVLGNSAGAKQIGQAVARFVAAPKRLTISLRAREPGGLGFADFAALNQPTDVLDRLEVTATAE